MPPTTYIFWMSFGLLRRPDYLLIVTTSSPHDLVIAHKSIDVKPATDEQVIDIAYNDLWTSV